MKYIIHFVTLLLASSAVAAAQVAEPAAVTKPSSQVSVQGSGLFARSVTSSGITYKPSTTEGVMAGYRFYFSRWLGVEGDADFFFHDAQKYALSNAAVSMKTSVTAVTSAAVIGIPNPMTRKLQSFVLIGGGAMIFRPNESSVDCQIKNAIVFGCGVDFPITRHIAIRAQARTFLYKAPDFQNTDLKVDKFTQAMVPSAGLVYKF